MVVLKVLKVLKPEPEPEPELWSALVQAPVRMLVPVQGQGSARATVAQPRRTSACLCRRPPA